MGLGYGLTRARACTGLKQLSKSHPGTGLRARPRASLRRARAAFHVPSWDSGKGLAQPMQLSKSHLGTRARSSRGPHALAKVSLAGLKPMNRVQARTECKPKPSASSQKTWVKAYEPLHKDIDTNNTCGIGPSMPFAHAILAVLEAHNDVISTMRPGVNWVDMHIYPLGNVILRERISFVALVRQLTHFCGGDVTNTKSKPVCCVLALMRAGEREVHMGRSSRDCPMDSGHACSRGLANEPWAIAHWSDIGCVHILLAGAVLQTSFTQI
ncbi:hypothetical protein CJ030_MR8G027692 [Morella rubra]|uniref:Sialate O-acetylesterase domain-containing protein n=1 Tax=Morella rubra TaxID=262757 RepID=A0A6A1UU46_9ROSI|nr:hypothetical protein CJ030_MR8G027692 [Morella rubra]